MKIRYTDFCLNPALRNTTTHLPQHRAQALIDSGAAVEVPRAPYGTPQWREEMAELEALRVASIPAHERQNIPTVPVWTLRFMAHDRKYVVQKSSLVGDFIYGETLVMDRGRPDFKAAAKNFVFILKQVGCPENIIQQWSAARNAPDYLAQAAARIAEDQKAAEEQRERERNAPKFI